MGAPLSGRRKEGKARRARRHNDRNRSCPSRVLPAPVRSPRTTSPSTVELPVQGHYLLPTETLGGNGPRPRRWSAEFYAPADSAPAPAPTDEDTRRVMSYLDKFPAGRDKQGVRVRIQPRAASFTQSYNDSHPGTFRIRKVSPRPGTAPYDFTNDNWIRLDGRRRRSAQHNASACGNPACVGLENTTRLAPQQSKTGPTRPNTFDAGLQHTTYPCEELLDILPPSNRGSLGEKRCGREVG